MVTQYPENDKLGRIMEERATLNEFAEWLTGQGYSICHIPESMHHTYMPVHESMDDMVYRMYGIDPSVLERERRQMLAAMAKANDFNG